MVRETGLLLVEIDGDELEMDGRTLLHFEQDIEHAVAVFAARDADHDAVSLLDHAKVHDGLAHLAAQAFFQLMGFVGGTLCCIAHGGGSILSAVGLRRG